MDYEIVKLEEKTIVGIAARTNNQDPDLGAKIGGLWQSFFQNGIYQGIPAKKNEKALGVYTDYAGTEMDEYTIIVASEVTDVPQLAIGMVKRSIPAGKYAKFIVRGDMEKDVADFWAKLWQMDLPRTYVSDFEEYQDDNMENAEIHIYIGIK
jgi:predicted transcriptional regulator YdeE